MGRLFNLVLVAAMIVGAMLTYDMKHKAEIAADRVARLQAEVAKEKDKITLLKAEWSMLTQPARLQELVGKYADYFQLEPFSPDQVGTIDEIPLRPAGAGDDASRTLARIAAGARVR
jgi:hypothetical protein